jgi:hypothetical protein
MTAQTAQDWCTASGLDCDYTPLEDIAVIWQQVPEEPMHLVGGLNKTNLGAIIGCLSTTAEVSSCSVCHARLLTIICHCLNE